MESEQKVCTGGLPWRVGVGGLHALVDAFRIGRARQVAQQASVEGRMEDVLDVDVGVRLGIHLGAADAVQSMGHLQKHLR